MYSLQPHSYKYSDKYKDHYFPSDFEVLPPPSLELLFFPSSTSLTPTVIAFVKPNGIIKGDGREVN